MLKIIGNVTIVLEGNLTNDHLQSIDQTQFRFALGGGTFSTSEAIGETLILEGTPYVSWVAQGKLRTESHSPLLSPFLVGLDPSSKPFQTLDLPQTSLQDLYATLATQHPEGLALFGSALSYELHSTYLVKPCIYHENINEHKDTYWAPASCDKNIPFCFFALILPPTASLPFPKERAFYKNPQEESRAAFDSHTHAALLKQIPYDRGAPVHGVRHLLTQTTVRSGKAELYSLLTRHSNR